MLHELWQHTRWHSSKGLSSDFMEKTVKTLEINCRHLSRLLLHDLYSRITCQSKSSSGSAVQGYRKRARDGRKHSFTGVTEREWNLSCSGRKNAESPKLGFRDVGGRPTPSSVRHSLLLLFHPVLTFCSRHERSGNRRRRSHIANLQAMQMTSSPRNSLLLSDRTGSFCPPHTRTTGCRRAVVYSRGFYVSMRDSTTAHLCGKRSLRLEQG